MTNSSYEKLVHDLFVWLLQNDDVANDATTKALFSQDRTVKARIITRQKVTIAGIEEVNYFLKTFTKLQISLQRADGEQLERDQTLMEVEGSMRELLAYERVLLNILQRLSGIATETATLIATLKTDKPYIAATRKTVWGLLDKKAVAIGGGLTHRLNLSDGILVKDNHIMLISPTDALQKLLQTVRKTLIQIEVEDEKTLHEIITLFTKHHTDNVLGILLDNFSPATAKAAIAGIESHPNIIFEASGGITPKNISQWTDTNVDIISLGALTHSSTAANLSFEITTLQTS